MFTEPNKIFYKIFEPPVFTKKVTEHDRCKKYNMFYADVVENKTVISKTNLKAIQKQLHKNGFVYNNGQRRWPPAASR